MWSKEWGSVSCVKNDKVKIGKSTLKDLAKLDLAFQLEAKHPELNFFEINRLVQQQFSKPKNNLRIVRNEESSLTY